MKLSKQTSYNIHTGLHEICVSYQIMVLGVTGGIASGKSSVAGMLEKMGLPIIDFDNIARQVVEPEQPAWHDIVSCFGKTVITDKQKIDRQILSRIVFNDETKRKKLEEITHPRITDQFINEIKIVALNRPRSIVQAVIPLLFEVNMENLVDKILVVYISPEKQIERLMVRDGIEKGEALKILRAQLPIDDKIAKADFVINNEGSLEETKKRVEKLYFNLHEIHKNIIEINS